MLLLLSERETEEESRRAVCNMSQNVSECYEIESMLYARIQTHTNIQQTHQIKTTMCLCVCAGACLCECDEREKVWKRTENYWSFIG